MRDSSRLKWPTTQVPKQWIDEWYDRMDEIFWNDTKRTTWEYREGTVRATANKRIVQMESRRYERGEGQRSVEYKSTTPKQDVEMVECEAKKCGD